MIIWLGHEYRKAGRLQAHHFGGLLDDSLEFVRWTGKYIIEPDKRSPTIARCPFSFAPVATGNQINARVTPVYGTAIAISRNKNTIRTIRSLSKRGKIPPGKAYSNEKSPNHPTRDKDQSRPRRRRAYIPYVLLDYPSRCRYTRRRPRLSLAAAVSQRLYIVTRELEQSHNRGSGGRRPRLSRLICSLALFSRATRARADAPETRATI